MVINGLFMLCYFHDIQKKEEACNKRLPIDISYHKLLVLFLNIRETTWL